MASRKKKEDPPGNGSEGVRFASRIVGYGEENTEQLLANPSNWRIHGKKQKEALEGLLDSVGWVQSVIVNKRTGFVVDGHLRVMLALKNMVSTVPVTYIDLTPEEEALVLATYDPIGEMAKNDLSAMKDLYEAVDESRRAAADFLFKKRMGMNATARATSEDEMRTAPIYELVFTIANEQKTELFGFLKTVKRRFGVRTSLDALVTACRIYKEEREALS